MNDKLQNRVHAGRLLAERLMRYACCRKLLVLGLPRGGVPVAGEIARALGAPMDAFLVRKLGVPGYEELAMGAIASGGVEIVDREIAGQFQLRRADIEEEIRRERAELKRQESSLRGDAPPPDLRGSTAILVDDGIATGSTMRAAIESAKQLGAARIVVAAGVAPLHTVWKLRSMADDVVCLIVPCDFLAVSSFYRDFPQVSDEEVRTLLEEFKKQGTMVGS